MVPKVPKFVEAPSKPVLSQGGFLGLAETVVEYMGTIVRFGCD